MAAKQAAKGHWYLWLNTNGLSLVQIQPYYFIKQCQLSIVLIVLLFYTYVTLINNYY